MWNFTIIVGWIAWKGDNFLVIQFKYDLTISKFSNLKKKKKKYERAVIDDSVHYIAYQKQYILYGKVLLFLCCFNANTSSIDETVLR